MLPCVSSRRSATPEAATDAASSRRLSFPEWVLLDKIGHIGRYNDMTTARSTTKAHGPIRVSFVIAEPPSLSRCVVDCQDLMGEDSRIPPCITGADGAFLLLSVSFRDPDGDFPVSDIFLYKAGLGAPSLHLLPEPYPVGIHSNYVGVLSCVEYCLVVVPEGRVETSGSVGYYLHTYSTRTHLWSKRAVKMACDMDWCYAQFEHTKVFAVGEDSLAWVDLRYGILVCEGIRVDPVMRFIQLPELMPINDKVNFKMNTDGTMPPLDMIRDVTFTDGYFRFMEMESHYLDSSVTTQQKWKINLFDRMAHSEDWEPYSSVDSANISPAGSCFRYLFSEIWDHKEDKLTLNKMICTAPTLNQYDNDVIYMIARLKADDTLGWVLVLNTEIMKVESIVPFVDKNLYFPRIFLESAFSKYFGKAPGVLNTNLLMEKFNKEDQLPLMLYGCSILIGQCQLRQFAKQMTRKRPSYLEIWSLFHSGVASTLKIHIRELAQFANRNGQGKVASDAANMFMRISKETDQWLSRISLCDPSTCCEAVREKINMAADTLDRILQVVPPELLDAWRGVVSIACTDAESVDEWGIAEKVA